jgi:hypothetical protein
MIHQCRPPIPVHVVENAAGFPAGNGQAVFLLDYSLEHHVLWAVAFDDGGAVFWVPNPFVRLQVNASAGRRPGKQGPVAPAP